MADFIPPSDINFNLWQSALIAWLSDPTNMTDLGITNAQLLVLTNGQGVWIGAYNAHVAAQADAKTASMAKDGGRSSYEGILRPFIAALQLNPKLTDADRVALGITVPATTRQPAAVPTTYPVPTIDFSMRLTHSIDFRDMATPNSKAKPAGVRGAQIWEKAGGPAPTSPDEFSFLATDTKAPYVSHFDLADIGKMIYYVLRWENTTGDVGPWSPIVSAVVPG